MIQPGGQRRLLAEVDADHFPGLPPARLPPARLVEGIHDGADADIESGEVFRFVVAGDDEGDQRARSWEAETFRFSARRC